MSTTPIYLHYRLHLHSPAIVSTLSGDPSSAATQPFIPGSTLRGALAARLLTNGISGESDEFHRLILSGAVRYLHAYPELAGDRSLPVSLSWKRLKAERDQVHDLAAFSGHVDVSLDTEDFDWPKEALSTVSEPFNSASVSSGARIIATPLIDTRLHQQQDRVKGRPWKDDNEHRHGVIFAYEYLEADQLFRGVIQINSGADADVERVKSLLGIAPILVGRSRRAGYGGEAAVEFVRQSKREYENASEAVRGDIPEGKCFRLLLASAYIGRHPETGQIDPCALHLELQGRLSATVERTRWAFETVGAFNQKWRLEVPQVQAVAAGAVLVLRSTAPISVDTLRTIEHEGLGERRCEGFGRILFLEHSDDNRELLLKDPKPVTRPTEDRESGDDKQLQFLEQRIVLAAARAELDRVAAIDLAGQAKKRPTSSLLGRLRTLFRGVRDEQSAQSALANLATWCGNGGDALKERARDQLKKYTVPDRSLFEWLQKLAELKHDQDGWEALLAASGNASTLTGLAARSHLTSSAAAEAVLRGHSALLRVYLIDALLSTLALQNRGGAT
jgi:CRISPR-associated protein Csx10